MLSPIYSIEDLKKSIFKIIIKNCSADVVDWLKEIEKLANDETAYSKFTMAFSLVSRKVPKVDINLSNDEIQHFREKFNHFILSDWDLQKLCRVWLILQLDSKDKEKYIYKVENLFKNAEMNELAALYSSLQFLAYPEHWKMTCAEGIRSNIGVVLDAVILNNPYPYRYLDENAWNQMILKAFFTDRDVHEIIGVEERANKNLLLALKDYVKERQAANRPIKDSLIEMIRLNENKIK